MNVDVYRFERVQTVFCVSSLNLRISLRGIHSLPLSMPKCLLQFRDSRGIS